MPQKRAGLATASSSLLVSSSVKELGEKMPNASFEPDIEEVGQLGILNIIVIRRIDSYAVDRILKEVVLNLSQIPSKLMVDFCIRISRFFNADLCRIGQVCQTFVSIDDLINGPGKRFAAESNSPNDHLKAKSCRLKTLRMTFRRGIPTRHQ